MSSLIDSAQAPPARPPVLHALGAGLHAALVADPVGLVAIPMLLYFPNMALEALQARFAGGLELEMVESPALALALSVGWGLALAGRLLGQVLVIRRTAAWLSGATPAPLEREFAGVMTHFPLFVAVFLLFCAALFFGLLLFVLPGLLVLLLWSFAPQVAALEHESLAGCFRRSRQAVRHQAGRWLAGAVLTIGGLTLLGIGGRLLWAGIEEGFLGAVPFGVYILTFAVMEFVAIMVGVLWTALYLDLEGWRAAHEPRPALAVAPPAPPAEPEAAARSAG